MTLEPWILKTVLTVAGFAGGSLLSLGITYVALSKDIAYIKGQLDSLIKSHEKLSKLSDGQVAMNVNLVKCQKDVNHAHEKIRDLKSA